MSEPAILAPRNWTDEELRAAGFAYLPPRPDWVVMVRELPASEAPLTIRTAWDTLVAEAGYMICFEAGEGRRPALYDYPHWPVRPDHFRDTYVVHDDPVWQPSPAQEHLLSLGCRPYRRTVGVWALKLTEARRVQSPESPAPVLAPPGAWLCIGAQGATRGVPYSTDETTLRKRYVLSQDVRAERP
jgi:hypothetical protein